MRHLHRLQIVFGISSHFWKLLSWPSDYLFFCFNLKLSIKPSDWLNWEYFQESTNSRVWDVIPVPVPVYCTLLRYCTICGKCSMASISTLWLGIFSSCSILHSSIFSLEDILKHDTRCLSGDQNAHNSVVHQSLWRSVPNNTKFCSWYFKEYGSGSFQIVR